MPITVSIVISTIVGYYGEIFRSIGILMPEKVHFLLNGNENITSK
jgi:hypothetical protein